MRTYVMLLCAAPLLLLTNCLRRWETCKAAGAWKVEKVIIHYYDSLEHESGSVLIESPGLLLLDYDNENQFAGTREFVLDTAAMAPSEAFAVMKYGATWKYRDGDLSFGSLVNNDFYPNVNIPVKELTREQFNLEYRIYQNNPYRLIYKEEWKMTSGS